MVIAVSECSVGVDAEKIREVDIRVKKRFTKAEAEYIGYDIVRFFEIWTKKEAFLKQKGVGLKGGLQSFCVTENAKISTFNYNDYIISVCFEKENTEYKKITA